jgi:hypothetical protein
MNDSNITKVYLLDVPLESDYKNTLYFTSKANQQSYFQSCIVKSYTDFTYQRKDKIIRIPDIVDNIYHCNYVMYQNSNYSNKWFYCFIDKMEYINDGRTDITIETDVIQTWLFDYTVKPSFVEREHVDNDTIGLHTVPEGLELGEYKVNASYHDDKTDNIQNDFRYILGLTFDYDTIDDPSLLKFPGEVYNGIYSGCKYYAVESASEIGIWLNAIDKAGKGDGVVSIFMAPKYLSEKTSGTFKVAPTSEPVTYEVDIPKLTTLDSYSPRNNKLKTWPYMYMLASNNNGGNVTYHFEKFREDSGHEGECRFSIKGALTPGCSIRMTPFPYNGAYDNESEALNLGKFPTCSWTNDAYTNWLTQNSVNIATNVTSATVSTIAGIGMMATGAGATVGAGMVAGGVMGIARSAGEMYQHSLVPPQASGNLNAGDVITGAGENCFHFYNMSIKQEYAKIIDKYFDMFGYKVNMVKTPNKAHRSRWWYTKTIDVNIDGAIPNDDMQTIKNAYNNGITFWRNASEIQNYNLTNGIV